MSSQKTPMISHEEYMRQRAEKQQYLVDEVINQDYDPNQFAQFISEKKSNGDDVDQWTFQALVNVVEEFKVLFKPIKGGNGRTPITGRNEERKEEVKFSNQDNLRQLLMATADENALQPQAQSIDVQQQEQFLRKASLSLEEQKKKEQIQVIKTNKYVPTKLNGLNTANIQVNVTDGQLIQAKKFLSTNYFITFRVQVPALGWEVRRNDQDFNVLQSYLQKQFPHILVPPITKYKLKQSADQHYFKKRGRMLQKFLKWVMKNQELKSDIFFISFLSNQDKKIYEVQLKAVLKSSEIRRIPDLTTEIGQAIVKADEVQSMMTDSNKLPKFVKSYEASHRRLFQQIKRLGEDFKITSITLQNIEDEFLILQEINSTFSKNQGCPQDLADFYRQVSETLHQWSDSLLQQKQVIDESLAQQFQFFALNGEGVVNFYERVTSYLDQYIKQSVALAQKKEKLFTNRDISNMDLPSSMLNGEQIKKLFDDKEAAFSQMLPKETTAVNELGQMFAYLIQQFKVELKCLQESSLEDLKVGMQEFSDAVRGSLKKQSEVWDKFDEKLK